MEIDNCSNVQLTLYKLRPLKNYKKTYIFPPDFFFSVLTLSYSQKMIFAFWQYFAIKIRYLKNLLLGTWESKIIYDIKSWPWYQSSYTRRFGVFKKLWILPVALNLKKLQKIQITFREYGKISKSF
jgi:hypothetical protein